MTFPPPHIFYHSVLGIQIKNIYEFGYSKRAGMPKTALAIAEAESFSFFSVVPRRSCPKEDTVIIFTARCGENHPIEQIVNKAQELGLSYFHTIIHDGPDTTHTIVRMRGASPSWETKKEIEDEAIQAIRAIEPGWTWK